MAEQSLDQQEMLNIRWATDDPNPAAMERDAQEANRKMLAAMMQVPPTKGDSVLATRIHTSRVC